DAVDEVHAAAVAVRLRVGDLDERPHRMGRVRQEDVVARGGEPEDAGDDHDQHQAGEDEPAGGQAPRHQRRFRDWPPSTGTTVPETYDARSEARKQTTSA